MFAWLTALGALGAAAGSAAPAGWRAVLGVLILVVLTGWLTRRSVESWWLVAGEAVAVAFGCVVLPSPEPMLGFLFGATTRRAVRVEVGPFLLRVAPGFVGYLAGACWSLFFRNPGSLEPGRIGPAVLPLVGLVIGTIALRDTVSAVFTARTALRSTAAAHTQLDTVLRVAPVAIVVLDPDHGVRMYNDQARELFGWTCDSEPELACPHGEDARDCAQDCLGKLIGDGAAEWTLHVTGAQRRTVSVRVAEFSDSAENSAENSALLLAIADITDRKDLEVHLRHQLELDHLTSAVSRGHLITLLRDALDAQSDDALTALLLIDLDDFKDVNDAYGHPTGDAFLIAAADRIMDAVSLEGIVGRLGGDEFAVLVQACDEHEVQLLGDRIRTALAGASAVGLNLPMRASIGLAVHHETDAPADEAAAVLMRDADTALYVAKRAGGDRVRAFEPAMRTALLNRQRDEAELRRALAEDQFELHYQPIIELATGTATGGEALIRWRHPDRGMLPPGPVVELAEETGLIVPLGNWALRAACRQAAHWAANGHAVRMSVNVSARQLHSIDFVGEVAAALDTTGLPPNLLTLELTESALIRPAALDVLSAIRALGVRIALDDFGTGYSSLSYLQKYPFDLIKIDRSFVGQLGTVPTAEGIVRCILDLAGILGIPVVAEGVETPAQAQFLTSAGCGMAQGYHFGKPAPAAEWHTTFDRRESAAARPEGQ